MAFAAGSNSLGGSFLLLFERSEAKEIHGSTVPGPNNNKRHTVAERTVRSARSHNNSEGGSPARWGQSSLEFVTRSNAITASNPGAVVAERPEGGIWANQRAPCPANLQLACAKRHRSMVEPVNMVQDQTIGSEY